MKRVVVGGVLAVFLVATAAAGQQLATKPALPSEIGDFEVSGSSHRGPGAAPGEDCSAGVQRVSIEGEPVPVIGGIVDASCAEVPDDLCEIILCAGVSDQADASCRGGKSVCAGTCEADQETVPLNGSCLVVCWSASLTGTCERTNGPSDPF